jgi:hypothetical protein
MDRSGENNTVGRNEEGDNRYRLGIRWGQLGRKADARSAQVCRRHWDTIQIIYFIHLANNRGRKIVSVFGTFYEYISRGLIGDAHIHGGQMRCQATQAEDQQHNHPIGEMHT